MSPAAGAPTTATSRLLLTLGEVVRWPRAGELVLDALFGVVARDRRDLLTEPRLVAVVDEGDGLGRIDAAHVVEDVGRRGAPQHDPVHIERPVVHGPASVAVGP